MKSIEKQDEYLLDFEAENVLCNKQKTGWEEFLPINGCVNVLFRE